MQTKTVNNLGVYSKSEIDTFQTILKTLSNGNIQDFKKMMLALSLNQLSRFKQFRSEAWDLNQNSEPPN